MAVLTPQQRNALESTVKQARKISEIGAFNALMAMAVNNPEPFTHMTAEQRSLRNNLRSKARLLSDELPANGAQRIDNLSYELAYETWHKMLFAKFLEANDLLIHTASGVAVSMEYCEELASDEGYLDKWDAAANYASKMLPAIFRTDDPLMQVSFATDERIKLEEIIDALEREIFVADDALGWVYQFWQSEAKAVINASGDKIDGAKLPAVTQLFTEPYMVHFLIDNTLGAWWVNRNPGVTPPIKFEYLRYLPKEDGADTEPVEVAAGNFEGWPDKTAQVTSLDPCMGSGHFVASLFPVFATLRMHEEGLTKEEATDKVIKENLHGLELDARCTQIAAFNLALTAWKFCGQYKELPEMNLACSGIAPKGNVEDWVKLAGKGARFEDKERMENGMRALYDHFQLAPELGSLLDPTIIKNDTFTASFEELQPILFKALENEKDTELLERGVIASGIAKVGEILSNSYYIVLTNVPFLGSKGQSDFFKSYFTKNFKQSKSDLANVMAERIFKLLYKNGVSSIVIPQNWLFTKYFEDYRKYYLKNYSINFLNKLGPGAFETISGEVVNVCCIIASNQKPAVDNLFCLIDVKEFKTAKGKAEKIREIEISFQNQDFCFNSPKHRISVSSEEGLNYLSKIAKKGKGSVTGDRPHYLRKIWELNILNKATNINWIDTPSTKLYSGRDTICIWNDNGFNPTQELGFRWHGHNVYNKPSIFLGKTNQNIYSLYSNQDTLFDDNVAVICPDDSANLAAILSFIQSGDFSRSLSSVDERIAVTAGSFVDVPFDLEHWQKVADEKYPNGLPLPYSDDPTQWLFHGHPIKTDNPLQVSTARLLGYRWPAESDTEMELADEARALIEQVKAFDHLSDEDGIFCIPSVNAEQAGADRLRTYLQSVFADSWGNNTINELLEKEGASSSNLEEWLRKEFFVQHCKVFQNRPFIWHIWDGRNDGFAALVNYHKLNKENLSKLIYTYLGDWIRMCEAKKKHDESGAEGLLSAALKLKEKLEAILHGEAPYDIFVRWKPLEQQPIGWEPDLNDGVRLNIRPFVEAGVLRNKFNVKWGVDRGKNPPESPWGEIRDNDKNLTLAEKREARENKNKA